MAFDEITYALLKGKTSSLQSEIDILNGDAETEGSVENKIAEAISGAPEEYEKLQQLQDWLDNHSDMEAALIDDVADLKTNKQDKLTEGEYITIDGNNVIDVKVDTTIDSTSTNPISNAAVAGIAAALEQVAQTASQAGGTADNAAELASQANSTANEAKNAVAGKQDKLTAGENITIENNIISATNTGNAKERELTQAEYDLLSPAQKNDGTTYYVTDGSSDPFQAGAAIDITDGVISVVADDTISGNSTNPVQNKKVAEAIAQLQNKDNQQDGVISNLGTQVSGVQNNLNTLAGTLNGKQDKLTDSDDITIDQNVIDLSQNFKDGLNSSFTNLTNATTANAHNIDLLNSDMEGVASSIVTIEGDLNDLERKEIDDVNAINSTLTTVTTAITDLRNNKQNKLLIDDYSGLVLEPMTEDVDLLRLQYRLDVGEGKGTYITSISSTAAHRPAEVTTYVNAKYSIEQGNDGKYYNYDTETDEYVFPVNDANNITFDSTASVDEGTVAKALQNAESNINEIGNIAGGAAVVAQQVQGQVQDLSQSLNSLYSTVVQLDGKYLPKQNPQYNGTFSSTGNYALGNKSIAIGEGSTATGNKSVAIGNQCYTLGDNSLAFGNRTTASGYYAIAEGDQTLSTYSGSHAEGVATTASAFAAHAEGHATSASGYNTHAEGANTIASNNYAHSEGYHTTASGYISHAEGYQTIANANEAHSGGYGTTAEGTCSLAHGYENLAQDECCVALGFGTSAIGDYSFAHGKRVQATKECAIAMGNSTTASGYESFAIGSATSAPGNDSFACGYHTTASQNAAVAIGNQTLASGAHSFAGGIQTTADGDNSIAFGGVAKALGEDSIALGWQTTASGKCSLAFGHMARATKDYQIVLGSAPAPTSSAIFTIGNGVWEDDNSHASNAFEVSEDGEAAAADFATTVDGTKYTLTQIISALKDAGILS